MNLKVRQPCLSEACQCTFSCKTCWADATKSVASPSGKGCWKCGEVEGGEGLGLPEKKLFDLLSLTSVNSQGSFSWCLNCLLCKEKTTAVRSKNLFALSINCVFFLLGILLTHEAHYIPICFPLKMTSVRFMHFCLLRRCTNIVSTGRVSVRESGERGEGPGGFPFSHR